MVEGSTLGRDADGDETANFLTAAVNSGIDSDEFGERLQSSHRWLQREVFYQVLKPGITALAAAGTDARNEQVVKACRQICDEMDWEY